jgi:DNA polymerase I
LPGTCTSGPALFRTRKYIDYSLPILFAGRKLADSSPIIKVDSIQSWNQALQEIKGYGVCGLHIETTGSDPLTSRIRSVQLALPNGHVYVADIFDLGKDIVDELAALVEDSQVKKVIYDAKVVLSFIRALQGHRLKFKNIFDVMLASQLCWSGYYDLVPSKSLKNPWKKRIPDHSLEALAERHLGIILDKSSRISDWEALEQTTKHVISAAKYAGVLLPLHAVLQKLLIKNTLMRVAELEFRTLSPVVEMEHSGIYLDADTARALMQEIEARMVEAFLELQAEAKKNGFIPIQREGKETSKYLNPDSQEDVKRYLQSRCFNITSTKSEILKELAMGGNIFADRLLSYRQISHQLAFLNSWLQDIHPVDGRIHPNIFSSNLRQDA